VHESTHTTTTENSPPTSYGFCSWHNRFAGDVRLIAVIEQGSSSGAGGMQYACPACIEEHRLTPYTDQS
jgi:hypothetical protein